MKTKIVLCCAFALIVAFGLLGNAQDDGLKGKPISFHVTSVSQKDDSVCDPKECSSVQFTIEGFSDSGKAQTGRVAYVLTCSEYWVYKPTPHTSMACARVHANSDYAARLFADSISFWPVERYTPPPMRAIYKIVSERER